jgi:hypothetical protein
LKKVDLPVFGIPNTAICLNPSVLATSNNGVPSGLHLPQFAEFVI